jgi:hypothetical protein
VRPDRFLLILADAAPSIPGITGVKTMADAGETKYPYGLIVEAAGRTTRWQLVCQSAVGDRFDREELEPRIGEPIEKPDMTAVDTDLADIARALVAAALATDPGEASRYDLYADREQPPSVGHGATIEFYDGSKIFLNAVR